MKRILFRLYRIAKTVIRYALQERDFLMAKSGGYYYVIPNDISHSSIAQHLMQGRVYEQETIQAIRTFYKGGTIIHAGVYIGDMLPHLNDIVKEKNGWVYGFEPCQSYYQCAKANVELNNLEKTILINKALSNDFEKVNLVTKVKNNNICGGAFIGDGEGETVKTTKIDFVFGYNRIGLIHLDLEGYELLALEGAAQIIKKYRPVIIVESDEGRSDRYHKLCKDNNYIIGPRVNNNYVLCP